MQTFQPISSYFQPYPLCFMPLIPEPFKDYNSCQLLSCWHLGFSLVRLLPFIYQFSIFQNFADISLLLSSHLLFLVNFYLSKFTIVLVWVLWEADVKIGLYIQEVYLEERGASRNFQLPCNLDVCREKEGKNWGLCRKNIELHCGSKKDLIRPGRSLQTNILPLEESRSNEVALCCCV